MAKAVMVNSYLNQPCERCGSKRTVSKTWIEKYATISGTSSVEVSKTICSNKECQALFEKNRAEELERINERKIKKEEQDQIRKENIAKTRIANKAKLESLPKKK